MITFLAISTLTLGILSIYLIKCIIVEREFSSDSLYEADNLKEKIDAIEMANNAFRKEFDNIKETVVKEKAVRKQAQSLLRSQNEFFRGVMYDTQNNTIVLAENLERIGEL